MPRSAIILGAGLGGLSAAIYARLSGLDVLVVEKGQEGGKAADTIQNGFRLEHGPSIVILPEIYEQVFKDAGRSMADFLSFERLDPITRVFFEDDDPLDLPADRQAALDLLKGINAFDSASMARFLELMDRIEPMVWNTVFKRPIEGPQDFLNLDWLRLGRGLKITTPYRQLVDNWFKSPLLRAFFYGFPSYSGQTYSRPAPGALFIPYFMLTSGVWYPRGGVGAIPRALATLARSLGVEFQTGEVASLDAENGLVTSAALTPTPAAPSQHLEADVFVSNVDRFTTEAWLGIKHEEPASFSYTTLHWGFKRSCTLLSHHNLVVPTSFEAGFKQLYLDNECPRDPIIYLSETAQTDPAAAPAGGANVFAVITTPSEGDAGREALRADMLNRVRGTLRQRFAPDQLPEFEEIQTPTTFRQRHGNYRGSLYGATEANRGFAGFPPSVRSPRFKNLFFCGGSVQPGAGMPMAVLSGKFAAEALANRLANHRA